MAEAAHLPFDYPEAAVVEEDSLADQNLAIAAELPDRPLVLGGCCSSHVGALEGLSARHDRLALVWLDAHGDLNTPATSPSGNAWGMPLRMIVDSGMVKPGERRADRRPEPRSARRDVHRRERDPHGPGCRRPRARGLQLRLRRLRRGFARSRRDHAVHARAGRSEPRRGRAALPRSPRPLHGGRRRPQRPRSRPGQRGAAGAPDPRSRAVTRARASRSNIASWRSPESTSRSRRTTRLLRMRRSIRTPARSASPTTGTTSSRRTSGSARTAGTTSRCAPGRGSSAWPTKAASRGGRRPALGRPPRLLRPPALRRAPRGGRARHGTR